MPRPGKATAGFTDFAELIGLAAARARGRVGECQPKLTADQAALARRLYGEREKTVQ